MAGYLTTHVLDVSRGLPAAGMVVVLHALVGHERREVARMVTNQDGRTDGPILPGDAFATGIYELEFHAGDWMDTTGIPAEDPRFLDVIPIRFGMSRDDHYHVPLLVSPFGFSTYRGS
ncbi:hydroxyisourate hydrolase [Paracoccus nototheniae]|uniref:5-hydroxyisourate hydrolase n=1 Tax=Paracoccus nototheniae TaxID=2489002 RepID=A0ABW4E0T4_9RHOB|nr:hydroxyisourate hydrolase [Paracoccus nototheniae]